MGTFLNYITTLPLLELIAMLLSLAYVILAAKGSLWCWPAAFISTAIYAVIFYDVSLLMDSALSVYYLIMAIYGYWVWQQNAVDDAGKKENTFEVTTWSLNCHIKIGLFLTLLSLVLGYVMATYTPAAFPYLDTFTTVFAIFATYLITQKIVENWLYWIVIDFVSIYLYIEKGLMPTVVLFMIYIVIASYGYIKWRTLYMNKIHQNQNIAMS